MARIEIEVESLEVARLEEHFDAFLCYESFHHSLEQEGLLRGGRGCLTNHGKICFAGEPIVENAPYPSGLNPDDAALFRMHTRADGADI